MNKRNLGIFILMLLFLVSSNTSAFAWNGSNKYGTVQDVHLNNTCWWAIELGFSQKDATNIAKYCDGVDFGPRYLDKTWHLDRRIDTGDSIDTRLKHANEEMDQAKLAISKIPGLGVAAANRQRNEAAEHLGRGIHALQDIYAHMDAGDYKPWYAFRVYEHGMKGVFVDAKDMDGTIKKLDVEYLYDDVLWDYTPDEGWHKHLTKEANSRWIKTKEATQNYLYEFLVYGYGPNK